MGFGNRIKRTFSGCFDEFEDPANWEIVGLGMFLLVHAFILVTRETETETKTGKQKR